MAASPTNRPDLARQHSKVPGGFDTDDDLSPIKPKFDNSEVDHQESRGFSYSHESGRNGKTSSNPEESEIRSPAQGDDSTIDENEMRRQLMDMESSFLPENSSIALRTKLGANDTSLFGSSQPDLPRAKNHGSPQSIQTPSESYKTPAPGHDRDTSDRQYALSGRGDQANTSSLETMSSSPTAAAAARTVSRVVSLASIAGYETAEEQHTATSASGPNRAANPDDSTPKSSVVPTRLPSHPGSPTPTRSNFDPTWDNASHGDVDEEKSVSVPNPRKRPRYVDSRHPSQRSSYSSYTSRTTNSTEGASDLTIGAEYALQTGGAAPFGGSSIERPRNELSRSLSLGSMASGISALSDSEDRSRYIVNLHDGLSSLAEEEISPLMDKGARGLADERPGPSFARALSRSSDTPTDIHTGPQAPSSLYDRNSNTSPERRNGQPTPATVRTKNLTLKEQGSTIDKLQKENWDLKMKIHYLDKALDVRSEEGVKAIISENVELKTQKLNAARELRNQKRLVREFENKLRESQERAADQVREAMENAQATARDGERTIELESKVTILRERIETREVEIEKLRQESSAKETEKRHLAQVVKSMTDRRSTGSDIGIREEMDMWKDLLETETARREQADEDNKKMREELWRLKADAVSTGSYSQPANGQNQALPRQVSSDLNQTESNSRQGERHGATTSSSVTLVEQLRHENAELRREVGAQTSMLTSRNREKERLYQEIEDLKMQRRGDGRSVAGDSILERSASRAFGRPVSQGSGITRPTQVSEAEREASETKIGELRDEISELKLRNQELVDQLDGLLDELEQANSLKADFDKLEQMYEELTEQTNQEILAMQTERDEALEMQEEADASFKDLKEEAQQRIDALEEELDQKSDHLERLENELANRDDESNNLQNEVRMMSEGLNRVEADIQAKVRRIQDLELENEDINREFETIEKSLREANGKSEKLAIELESRQGECAFLREEQDGCMLKIGDLEDALKAANTNMNSEKDRTKDLESRLADERHQREVIGSKEKQEVQKIMNDLNREAAGAKDESRKLRKTLETRENEVMTWKERLADLENSLREVLGDSNASKSNVIAAISKLQKDLDNTVSELSTTRQTLSEKDRLLQKRDALLESHGLESRKLSELLEKERSARRADEAQHEHWQKTHQHSSRTVTQKDTQIAELEASRAADKKKSASLEQQMKEQMQERNNLLLALWHRLASLCGNDWQHQNSLVSGHLPTLEVVAGMLPGFSKNLLNAVKTIEGMLGGFRSRIRGIERDMMKDVQTLEHNLDMRIKRLDRLESAVQVSRVAGAASAAPEIAKLRGENRLLKAELAIWQKQEMHGRAVSRADSRVPDRQGSSAGNRASMSASLMRHHSASAVEALERGVSGSVVAAATTPQVESRPIEPSQQRWIHRLRELERRLKAEREARLLDRSGARKRLEEGRAENEELRLELERERVRAGK